MMHSPARKPAVPVPVLALVLWVAVAPGGVGAAQPRAVGPAADSLVALRVVVEGVSGGMAENVRSALGILTAAGAGDSVTLDRVRRLHRRAPREIRTALEPFGYYEPAIDAELRPGDGGWVARYGIDPGRPVTVRAVEIRLSGPGRAAPGLREVVEGFPLEEGDPLRHAAYERGKAALREWSDENGYLDASFGTREIRVDRDARSAEIVLAFDTGPRYLFGPITFDQDVLDRAVLARYAPFEPGDSFHVSGLLQLQSRLRGLPYFAQVALEPRPTEARDRRVPIRVQLRPHRPWRLEGGVGAGTNTGPRVSGEVEQRRINRKGHRARAEFLLSSLEQSMAGRYLIPILPDGGLLTFFTGFARLDLETSRSDQLVAGTNLAHRRGPWTETLSLDFEHESFEVGEQKGTSNLLIPSIDWFRTVADDRAFPTRGYRIRFDVQASHDVVFSSATHAQFQARGKIIRPLSDRSRLIARVELGGILTDDFRALPPTIRFFAGGDGSVRGYSFRSLGPENEAGEVIGGEALTVASVELDYFFLESWGIAGFFDTGNAFDPFDVSLKSGTGLGLRWRSPVGPVRLDGAFPLDAGASFRLHLVVGPEL